MTRMSWSAKSFQKRGREAAQPQRDEPSTENTTPPRLSFNSPLGRVTSFPVRKRSANVTRMEAKCTAGFPWLLIAGVFATRCFSHDPNFFSFQEDKARRQSSRPPTGRRGHGNVMMSSTMTSPGWRASSSLFALDAVPHRQRVSPSARNSRTLTSRGTQRTSALRSSPPPSGAGPGLWPEDILLGGGVGGGTLRRRRKETQRCGDS